jgi:glutathione S-transferase
MILVGRYLSPFTRRVAVSMRLLGLAYEHNPLATTTDKEAIRKLNPLARVPALILDDGEVLIDSAAILDHVDELAGPERALVPGNGADRRAVLRIVALAIGACEKTVSAYYELNRRPEDKCYMAWVEDCRQQVLDGFADIEAVAGDGWLVGGRISQADVSTVCAFDFACKVQPEIGAAERFPRLAALSRRANALPAFAETQP